MKRLALVLVLAAVVALIVWAASRKGAEPVPADPTDELVMRFIETAVLPQARHSVGGHCVEQLATPVVVDLAFEAQTFRRTIKLAKVRVLDGDPDAGSATVSTQLAVCIVDALEGFETRAPRLEVPVDGGADAGTRVVGIELPSGRSYELTVTLELARLEQPSYEP